MGRRGARLRQALTVGLLGLVVAAGLAVVRPTPAVACSCAVDSSPTQALQRADVVFAGELVRIDRPLSRSSGAPQQLRFEVSRVYKGEVGARTTVHTAQSSSSCGLGLDTTGPYVVFGTGGGADVRSGACSGLLTGTAVPAAFGAGREPTADDLGPWSTTAPSPSARFAVAGGVTTLAAAIVVAVLLVRRRRRRS